MIQCLTFTTCPTKYLMLTAQHQGFEEKLSEMQLANELSRNELANSQAESERGKVDLQCKTTRINELETLLEKANALNNELLESNARFTAREIVGDSDTTNEKFMLNDDVETKNHSLDKITDHAAFKLHEDIEAKRDSLDIEMPSSSASEAPPDWKSSPINHFNDQLLDATFCADDTFDESMFLPNVQAEEPKTSIIDGNTSPKAQLDDMRVIYGPPEEAPASSMAVSKIQTPVKRLTRSMKNKSRTPFGKSAIQNVSSSTTTARTKGRKMN